MPSNAALDLTGCGWNVSPVGEEHCSTTCLHSRNFPGGTHDTDTDARSSIRFVLFWRKGSPRRSNQVLKDQGLAGHVCKNSRRNMSCLCVGMQSIHCVDDFWCFCGEMTCHSSWRQIIAPDLTCFAIWSGESQGYAVEASAPTTETSFEGKRRRPKRESTAGGRNAEGHPRRDRGTGPERF